MALAVLIGEPDPYIAVFIGAAICPVKCKLVVSVFKVKLIFVLGRNIGLFFCLRLGLGRFISVCVTSG
jgi:hypothetical protein